jgi:uncharacterized protein
MENKIYFKDSYGNKLSAIFFTPSDKIVPVVILCHGLNSGKDSSTNTSLSKLLVNHNIATFRFDFFAHGESEGNIDDRDLEKFVDGIQSGIKYLKNLGFEHIGIVGTSFGGVASVIYASKSQNLEFMILKSAGMGQTSRKMSNYKIDFDLKSWIKAGKKVKTPTLIVHGAKDEDVELQLGKDLANSIESSKLEIFENADHRFTKKEDFDACIKVMFEFILSHFRETE